MSLLPFDPQPHLVGDIVELRPLRSSDFADLYAVASDPLIWPHRNNPLPRIRPRAQRSRDRLGHCWLDHTGAATTTARSNTSCSRTRSGFVNRVVFLIHPQNVRSQRAVERIGAVRAGSRLDGAEETASSLRSDASRNGAATGYPFSCEASCDCDSHTSGASIRLTLGDLVLDAPEARYDKHSPPVAVVLVKQMPFFREADL
jgi:hypothetical protein